MSLRSEIQDAMRSVVAALGETWQYRLRTSGPSVQTATYGAWANVTAHATGLGAPQEWDDKRQAWKRVERIRVRISDAVAVMHQGDQLKDTASVVYAVEGIASNAPNTGTVAYDCARTVPLKGEAGGGRSAGA